MMMGGGGQKEGVQLVLLMVAGPPSLHGHITSTSSRLQVICETTPQAALLAVETPLPSPALTPLCGRNKCVSWDSESHSYHHWLTALTID